MSYEEITLPPGLNLADTPTSQLVALVGALVAASAPHDELEDLLDGLGFDIDDFITIWGERRRVGLNPSVGRHRHRAQGTYRPGR